MSTYYHLVCDTHRATSGVIGGRSFPNRWWSENNDALGAFLEGHATCEPRATLVSEQDDRTFEYDEVPERGVAMDP